MLRNRRWYENPDGKSNEIVIHVPISRRQSIGKASIHVHTYNLQLFDQLKDLRLVGQSR